MDNTFDPESRWNYHKGFYKDQVVSFNPKSLSAFSKRTLKQANTPFPTEGKILAFNKPDGLALLFIVVLPNEGLSNGLNIHKWVKMAEIEKLNIPEYAVNPLNHEQLK